jgi:ubiquinone/menaquinone biosynthesis C-methylase UbiE
MPEDRERLRATFDAAAARYQQARPDYPADLFGELVRLAGLSPGDRLLEVGCATGKATLPLRRHWGAALHVARRRDGAGEADGPARPEPR